MTVYVDTMRAKYKGMIMCHMIADTELELHDMANKIGVQRKWYQGDHYDICLSKKEKAIQKGALVVTPQELASMCHRKKVIGKCGDPKEAVIWFREELRKRKILAASKKRN